MPFESLPAAHLQFPELRPTVVPPMPVWDTGPLLSLISKNITENSPYNRELRSAQLEDIRAQRKQRELMSRYYQSRSDYYDQGGKQPMASAADVMAARNSLYVSHGELGHSLAGGADDSTPTDEDSEAPLPESGSEPPPLSQDESDAAANTDTSTATPPPQANSAAASSVPEMLRAPDATTAPPTLLQRIVPSIVPTNAAAAVTPGGLANVKLPAPPVMTSPDDDGVTIGTQTATTDDKTTSHDDYLHQKAAEWFDNPKLRATVEHAAKTQGLQPIDVIRGMAPKPVRDNNDGSTTYADGVVAFPDGHKEFAVGDRKWTMLPNTNKWTAIVPPKTEPETQLYIKKVLDSGGNPETFKENGQWTPAALQKLAAAAASGGLAQGATGEEVLKGLSPEDAQTVKKMADYEWPVPTGGIRNQKQLRLMQLASIYDPSFNPGEYAIRQGLKREYTSGKVSPNIRSLNTLTHHAEQLEGTINDLHNSGFPLWNSIANTTKEQTTGFPALKQFNITKNAVTGELNQLLEGKAITDSEAKQWANMLNSSNTPAELQQTVDGITKLAAGRLMSLKETYERQMARPMKPNEIPVVASPETVSYFLKKKAITPELAKELMPPTSDGSAAPTATPSPSPNAPPPQGIVPGKKYFDRVSGKWVIWQNGQFVVAE